ncbi:MAG TPA: hypothetical protein V6C97_35250 [Oculatellaceae cyanobacterium]
MPLHNLMKTCLQCGYQAELHVQVCPKCKTVFLESQSQIPTHDHSIDESLSPAEILANMQKKQQEKEQPQNEQQDKSIAQAQPGTAAERTISQAQADAIAKERAMFSKRFKDIFKD